MSGPESAPDYNALSVQIEQQVNDAFCASTSTLGLMIELELIAGDTTDPQLDGTRIPNADRWRLFQNVGSDLPLNGCAWR